MLEAIIETSTLSPECKLRNEKKVSDHGIMMLDCPISGTGKQAETGDIVLYASGSKNCMKVYCLFSKHSLGKLFIWVSLEMEPK